MARRCYAAALGPELDVAVTLALDAAPLRLSVPPPLRPAGLPGVPLAVSEQLQVCAVHHEVGRANAGLDTWLACG